jgi:putative RecB family exonuclease
MGSRVHEALERLYHDVLHGKEPQLEAILEGYSISWNKSLNEGVVVNAENMTHSDYLFLGEKCICDYYLAHSPFSRRNLVACELRVDIDLLGDGNYRLVGFIDRLDRHGNAYEIHDYKTTGRIPGQAWADRDRQPAIYELGLRQKFSDIEQIEYVWHYLRHGRQLRSRRSKDGLQAHKNELIRSIHKIEESIVEDWFPPVRTPKCAWCEYQSICPTRISHRQTTL